MAPHPRIRAAVCIAAAGGLLVAPAGCGGNGDAPADTTGSLSPQAVAEQFVDGAVASDPEACSLLTDAAAGQVEIQAGAGSCAEAIQDPGAVAAIFGVKNGTALQSAAAAGEAKVGSVDSRIILDLGRGRSVSIHLVEEGGEWRIRLIRQSTMEVIRPGG